MITVITGAPGTGKSAALVSLLKELSSDRAVYVNGIPDLKIDHQELLDPTKWMDEVPDGSIIVIDEVQRIWRPRGPGSKVPPDISALETHRHRGLDFYLVTQSPRLIDSNVRGLTGRHVHLRDIGVLGRYWYEWPECADQCATSWKNAPIKKRYRLPKAIFADYKSASVHVKPIRSFPVMLVVMVLALLVTLGVGYRTWTAISSKVNPVPALASAPVPGQPVLPSPHVDLPPAQPAFIDDRIAFIPRISNKPETAPAYDALRVVVNMPVISGAVCSKGSCKCFTQQGTDTGLSNDDCKQWMKNPSFDHYRLSPAPPAPAHATKQATADPVSSPVASKPMPDSVINPKADSNPPPFALRLATLP